MDFHHARQHRITHAAATTVMGWNFLATGTLLATGAGTDIRVWRWAGKSMKPGKPSEDDILILKPCTVLTLKKVDGWSVIVLSGQYP